MKEQLITFIEKLKNNPRASSFSEDQTKQASVLPILKRLGWDVENIEEVFPEFSIEGRRVDYSLRINNQNKIFIEAKKPSEDLDSSNHQEQLLDYSFREGVKLAVLTNGITWSFYLPLTSGDWKSRKCYTIDIFEQACESVADKFVELLSRINIESGKAFDNAESLYKSTQKEKAIQKAIYDAWNGIIKEPDSVLVELIAERIEKISGYKPDLEYVKKFFQDNESIFSLSEGIVEKIPKSYHQPKTYYKTTRGRKGYDQLEDYLIPAIKLIRNGQHHTDVFKQLADKLKVKYSTVSAQCTRYLGISTYEFANLIKDGKIKYFLKEKLPQRKKVIEEYLLID